jgi:hypothetical protein
VQILEESDPRLLPVAGLQNSLHEAEELALPGLGIHARNRALGVGYAEKLEQDWKSVGERFIQEEQRSRDLPARLFIAIPLRHTEEATHELEHGKEGDRLAVCDTVRLTNPESLRSAALDELEAEAALSHASFGHHPDDLSISLKRS